MGKEVHLTHSDAVSSHAPPPVRNAQLEARVAKLRARLADREYAAMVRDVSSGHGGGGTESISRMLRNAAPASSVGFNLVATMGTCFTAAYFLTNAMTGSKAMALGTGAVAIAGALAVEATLVLTRLYRIEQAEEELERKKRKQVDKQALHHMNNHTKAAISLPKISLPEHTAPRLVAPKRHKGKEEEDPDTAIVPQEEKKTQ